MLSDPQTITVNAVAKVMPRILNEGSHSFYRLSDLTFSLDIRHRQVTRDKKRRVISTVAFAQRKIVADPLTSINDYETFTDSIQWDRPEVGFTATEIDQHQSGFKTWFDSTMVTKIFGQET